ncbi:MAG: o-succinylbenzoate--CoA ligase [Chloroflexota bacterium]
MDWLAARMQSTPEAVALQIGERVWTYGELDWLVGKLAGELAVLSVQRNDFVAVLMHNSLDYVCLIHALARIGAVLIPLNTRLSLPEIAWQLEHTGAGVLLFDEGHEGVVDELGGQVTDSRWQVASGRVYASRITHHASDPSTSSDQIPQPPIPNLQSIIFTSGTTGRPKGVMLTYENHLWSANGSAYRLGLDVGERWLSCLPLYHVGGQAVIFRSCLYGTAVILHPKYDTVAISESLDNDNITLVSLVPTMVYRLLEYRHRQAKPWPSSLRHLLLGGAASTPDLVARCRAHSIPLSPTYGLTEADSQVATMTPDRAFDKPGCVGKPLMFSSVRIVGENGETQPTGVYGEVAVSGPTVMAGYFKNPEATAKTIVNGELRTGDIGYLDEDGDLWLVQRRSDIIVSGGENVYPAEVEGVLREHEQVTAVSVVGLPDPEWGQLVAAVVVKTGELTAVSLQQYARQQLAGYKIPRHILFVNELPQTASGKIHRPGVEALFNNEST